MEYMYSICMYMYCSEFNRCRFIFNDHVCPRDKMVAGICRAD